MHKITGHHDFKTLYICNFYFTLQIPRNPFEVYRERALRKQKMVERHAQTQSVIMAEQYLANSGDNKDQICTQRSFCDIATNEDLRSETSIAAAEAIR